MRRRAILTGLAATACTGLPARRGAGQMMPTMPRVGLVSIANPRSTTQYVALEGRLRELGYVEGRNLVIDFIFLDGQVERYGEAMRALVARKADVLIALGPELSLKAAMAATTEIPIVMVAFDYDPLALGHVASLAQPGGNVTGLFLQQVELAAKRMQFLREAFPRLRAATVFWDAQSAHQWRGAQEVSSSLGLEVAGIELAAQPYDYDAALARAPADHRRMVGVCNSARFFSDRVRLAEFALRNGAATIFAFREWVEAGGLMSYGPGLAEISRRTADYVDRLARGAKPTELPIEQPTRFELVVNLRTARMLGIDLPPSIFARADEVIE